MVMSKMGKWRNFLDQFADQIPKSLLNIVKQRLEFARQIESLTDKEVKDSMKKMQKNLR